MSNKEQIKKLHERLKEILGSENITGLEQIANLPVIEGSNTNFQYRHRAEIVLNNSSEGRMLYVYGIVKDSLDKNPAILTSDSVFYSKEGRDAGTNKQDYKTIVIPVQDISKYVFLLNSRKYGFPGNDYPEEDYDSEGDYDSEEDWGN